MPTTLSVRKLWTKYLIILLFLTCLDFDKSRLLERSYKSEFIKSERNSVHLATAIDLMLFHLVERNIVMIYDLLLPTSEYIPHILVYNIFYRIPEHYSGFIVLR